MTIEFVPAADSPWRAYPAPKDVDLSNGPWCPMNIRTGLLTVRQGLVCTSCGAHWDQHGRNGRWLNADKALIVNGQLVEHDEPVDVDGVAERPRRIGRVLACTVAAGAVIGGGYATGRASRPYADLVPDALLWTVSLILIGLLLTGAGLLLGWRWWTSRTEGGAE